MITPTGGSESRKLIVMKTGDTMQALARRYRSEPKGAYRRFWPGRQRWPYNRVPSVDNRQGILHDMVDPYGTIFFLLQKRGAFSATFQTALSKVQDQGVQIPRREAYMRTSPWRGMLTNADIELCTTPSRKENP
jgi:hypothetical protein